MARLEKLEDSFLASLQEIRAVKAEIKKRTEISPALEKLLDAKTVAELLGQTERQIYQQAKKQELPSVRIGKYWMFSPAALQKWLDRKNNP